MILIKHDISILYYRMTNRVPASKNKLLKDCTGKEKSNYFAVKVKYTVKYDE